MDRAVKNTSTLPELTYRNTGAALDTAMAMVNFGQTDTVRHNVDCCTKQRWLKYALNKGFQPGDVLNLKRSSNRTYVDVRRQEFNGLTVAEAIGQPFYKPTKTGVELVYYKYSDLLYDVVAKTGFFDPRQPTQEQLDAYYELFMNYVNGRVTREAVETDLTRIRRRYCRENPLPSND